MLASTCTFWRPIPHSRLGRRHRAHIRSTLGKAAIASRNSLHLSLRFGIVQFAGTDARLMGGYAADPGCAWRLS
jgi:hypothetical protein